MEATSIDGLVAHCQSARFTGILRMRAREGIGEVWFLSGVADEVHFGVSTGDEAMDRMRKATEATYELDARLPHPAGGFKSRFPAKGSIATATPVTLMRYCEQYALTCNLAVESHHVLVEAKYSLGELVSVETTADDDGITAMLEAHEGTYEFTLPRVELPPGTPVLPPASPSVLESLPPPESLGFRALLETKPAIGRAPSDETEVKRKTVEIARQTKAVPRSEPAPAPDNREAEKREAEKREAEKREAERRAAEKREADKREAEKRAAEKREAEKREAEKREAELAAEKLAAEKLAAEKAEAEKLAAEKAEAEKLEAEKLEAEKLEAEKRAAAAKAEAEKPAEKEEATDERDDDEPPPPPPLAQRASWTWVAVPLALLVVLAYMFWTHRF